MEDSMANLLSILYWELVNQWESGIHIHFQPGQPRTQPLLPKTAMALLAINSAKGPSGLFQISKLKASKARWFFSMATWAILPDSITFILSVYNSGSSSSPSKA